LGYGHLVDSLEVFPDSVKSETCRPYGHVTSLTVNAELLVSAFAVRAGDGLLRARHLTLSSSRGLLRDWC